MVPAERHGHGGFLVPACLHQHVPGVHRNGEGLDLVGRVLGLLHVRDIECVPRSINGSDNT